MGGSSAAAGARLTSEERQLLSKFALLMRERYGARLLLFGSRARGMAHAESDYDLIAVARAFSQQRLLGRAPDRRKLWREAGGWGIGLDLHCFTPEEFRAELQGIGFIGQSKRRGELIEVKARRAA